MILLPIAILAVQDSDDRQFMERLYLEYRRLMYAIAFRVMGDHNDIEDIINTSCEKLIRKISEIRDMNCCTLKSYVVSTVRNTAINYVTKRNRQGRYVLGDGEELLSNVPYKESDVDRDLLRREDISAMENALMKLTELERDLLRMKYYDELSDQEIAKIIGVKESSVRMYLTRARRRALKQMQLGGEVE